MQFYHMYVASEKSFILTMNIEYIYQNQVLKIGDGLLIAALPGEFTTMAGR